MHMTISTCSVFTGMASTTIAVKSPFHYFSSTSHSLPRSRIAMATLCASIGPSDFDAADQMAKAKIQLQEAIGARKAEAAADVARRHAEYLAYKEKHLSGYGSTSGAQATMHKDISATPNAVEPPTVSSSPKEEGPEFTKKPKPQVIDQVTDFGVFLGR